MKSLKIILEVLFPIIIAANIVIFLQLDAGYIELGVFSITIAVINFLIKKTVIVTQKNHFKIYVISSIIIILMGISGVLAEIFLGNNDGEVGIIFAEGIILILLGVILLLGKLIYYISDCTGFNKFVKDRMFFRSLSK